MYFNDIRRYKYFAYKLQNTIVSSASNQDIK